MDTTRYCLQNFTRVYTSERRRRWRRRRKRKRSTMLGRKRDSLQDEMKNFVNWRVTKETWGLVQCKLYRTWSGSYQRNFNRDLILFLNWFNDYGLSRSHSRRETSFYSLSSLTSYSEGVLTSSISVTFLNREQQRNKKRTTYGRRLFSWDPLALVTPIKD